MTSSLSHGHKRRSRPIRTLTDDPLTSSKIASRPGGDSTADGPKSRCRASIHVRRGPHAGEYVQVGLDRESWAGVAEAFADDLHRHVGFNNSVEWVWRPTMALRWRHAAKGNSPAGEPPWGYGSIPPSDTPKRFGVGADLLLPVLRDLNGMESVSWVVRTRRVLESEPVLLVIRYAAPSWLTRAFPVTRSNRPRVDGQHLLTIYCHLHS